MIQLETVPIISSNIIGRVYDQEAVLVDTDNAQIKVVNDVGAFIWANIDGSHSVRDIAHAVCNEYEVDPEQAEQDTLEFITDLHKRGLVKTAS